MKNQTKTLSLSMVLVGALAGGLVGITPIATAADASQQLTPELRSELTRVKQSVAFAENLQQEGKHNPRDVYKSLDDATSVLDRLLASKSLAPEVRGKLESIKSGIQTIMGNLDDTTAYTAVRGLLEPMTDNPGE